MASLNKIMIIGNVGRDPELRMTANGKPVTEFSVAVNRIFNDGASGERREETEWFRVVCWQRLAETAQQLIQKGRLVFVEGRLQTRPWTDREGKERLSVEIIANDFRVLDSRRDREGGMGGPGQEAQAPKAPNGEKQPGFDPDEIPF
jgi:single-strand DNA-binding protein